MSSVINLRLLEPGAKIGLADGSTAEVVTNPLDGIWVFARYLSAPSDSSLVGTEEMIFAQDIVEILKTSSASPTRSYRQSGAPSAE